MDSSDALMARFLALHPRTIDLSLGRIQSLLARLNHPERRLPPVIHVGGTNGKGSTIAFMRAILEAGGLAAHVYTSPHLVRFHERIRLGGIGGGHYVPEDRLAEAFARCEAANAGDPITVFEITTAAALLLFSEAPADVLLLEVGLGGRVDATNVIDTVAAAVVTPIGRDHAEYLGDTVELVAIEKAGIFKRGCPAVIAAQDYAEADAVLCRRAAAVGATPVWVGNQDFSVHEDSGRLVYQDETDLFDLPRPKLVGRHQFTNAGTAIAALRAAGFGDIGVGAVEAGLRNVDWPGRMQRLARGRLAALVPPGSELWLDGGHNIDGGRILATALADLGERSDVPLVLIVGLLGTKDAEGFLRHFVGLARALIAVPIAGSMAARPAEEVEEIATQVGLSARIAPSIEAALTMVADIAFEQPPRILICGSLYLVGAVLTANGTPPT
ncbi:bifunctional folylpolyglutamate synthase/dihydrofolate synthase [Methylobacterium sp. WL30]|jgi:dihydrofolate synthase/folylpolyglutamate synthase|uniref:bifunctional folylpolyglutamate synthase/dihydrofolate synthase n=1 Tax=unclassified Methylobacterium TaxID=2615210 RepID=UPI0011C7A6D0|nr:MULTISPECIES: folylpolyglutamate synthase/dihydrofolate synthase family protein [unclassified Methylobacterium]MCJ2008328.1 bifunctional folylpolyglutamate synthase/dihydrofolate synthase [Methylobacterium sp. J-092]MCJ2041586.1 bifunctional folylpolyglutamate synthase/dihydrofolate synthase [Methylobacterium sp. J-059]MCJ2076438.1 bifunctional folylpolyglutamate synthase/dihydrofolate synthase [Methylobacterium sp. E-016]TXM90408.1 bifunctional folylpolyglutamate synthase/dihydrofolate synt